MLKAVNIASIFKMIAIILVSAFMLTGCSTEKNGRAAEASAMGNITGEEAQQELSQSHRECWQSQIIDYLYVEMGRVALSAYGQITKGALPLMMVAFALWTIFRLLTFMGSFTEESPGELWNEILRKLFICLICGIIASSTTQLLWLLNTVIFPIYYAFLELGSAILNSSNIGGNESGVMRIFQEIFVLKQPIMCSASGVGKASIESLSFPEGPRTMMSCLICAVNERLTIGFYLSFKVMSAPGFTPSLVGLIILICFTFVKLGFVFYLVDSIFRFTMMVFILPILVMSYAFKQTASWAKNGFVTIINSAALMMFMAVMITTALLAMEQIIADNADIFDGADKKSFQEFSIPFMCMLLVGFLLVACCNLAQQVTDSLVGGDSSAKFQSRAVKLTGDIAKGLWKKVWGLDKE